MRHPPSMQQRRRSIDPLESETGTTTSSARTQDGHTVNRTRLRIDTTKGGPSSDETTISVQDIDRRLPKPSNFDLMRTIIFGLVALMVIGVLCTRHVSRQLYKLQKPVPCQRDVVTVTAISVTSVYTTITQTLMAAEFLLTTTLTTTQSGPTATVTTTRYLLEDTSPGAESYYKPASTPAKVPFVTPVILSGVAAGVMTTFKATAFLAEVADPGAGDEAS